MADVLYKIEDFLKPEAVCFNIQGNSSIDIIRAMVNRLYELSLIEDLDDALGAVLSREEIMPTGLCCGIAIPHGKSDIVKNTVMSVARLESPVDFSARDGILSKHVALFIIRKKEGSAVNMEELSVIAKPFMDEACLGKLDSAKTTNEYYKILVGCQNA